ncbi:MAG: ABC transporter ATP-binding protein [Bdellovibrio sp.]|nr:ABC transporter ATP-binding protein [Bdellovibrio sp.]
MSRPIPKTLTRFIWHFLRPHRWKLLWIVIPMVYSAIHLSLEPYLLKLIIDQVNTPAPGLSTGAASVTSLKWLFILVTVLLICAWRVKDYATLKILPALRTAIIDELFNYINHHSYRYYQENFAGNLANKIKEISTGIEDLFETFREVFRQLIVVVMAAAMTVWVDVRVSLILLGWAVAFITVGLAISRKLIIEAEKLADSRSVTFGKIVDSISNNHNVRLFSRHGFERSFLRGFLLKIQAQDIRLRLRFMVLWTVQGALVCGMLGLLLHMLISLRGQNRVSVGDFAFVMWVAVGLIDQVWMLTETLSRLPQHIGVCSQGLALISPDHEIVDAPGALPFSPGSGSIEFKDVGFSYAPGRPLFDELNLRIESGTKVGLVGFSGSGKSSFAHLLVRLFDLQRGRILIDGQDISQVTQQSLREAISFIPQDPSLFHRSLMDNIRYGNPAATDEDVIEAAKLAHAHGFILKTQEGYASMVGERGIKLSGGQRQRISIARAILKNSQILILDEATSALDSVTEALIQESLHSLMMGKTALVIAHRLSTLLEMDRILVFHNGKIIEDGTHAELLELHGHYAQLWDSQVGGFLPDSSSTGKEEFDPTPSLKTDFSNPSETSSKETTIC